MRVIAALALLAACSSGPDQDRDAYLAGMGDPRACADISSPDLRAECVSFSAVALTWEHSVDKGQSACRSLDGRWREECFFLVAEAAELRGPAAREACTQAGAWASHCLDHLKMVTVERLIREHGVGQEIVLMQEIGQAARDWSPEAPEEEVTQTTFQVVAHTLARRAGNGVFERRTCGAAPDPVCVEAYGVSLARMPGGTILDSFCSGPIQAERARDEGLRPWDEAAQPIAEAYWSEQCAHLGPKGLRQRRHHTPLILLPPPLPPPIFGSSKQFKSDDPFSLDVLRGGPL